MKQIGPAPEGLAVWEKTTSSVALPGGSSPNESVREVIELFEGTLPDKFFEPPVGYQQVTTLSPPSTLPSPPTPRERAKAVLPSWVPASHTPGRAYDQAYANRLELHEWAAKRREAGADGDFLAPLRDRAVLPLPEGVGGGWGEGEGNARFPFVLWGFEGGDLTRTPQLLMPTVEKPEYSKEAREAKRQGTVVLWVEVDPTVAS